MFQQGFHFFNLHFLINLIQNQKQKVDEAWVIKLSAQRVNSTKQGYIFDIWTHLQSSRGLVSDVSFLIMILHGIDFSFNNLWSI